MSEHPLILVTGATGKTGGAVVAQLRARNAPVRAMVRARDRRSERLRALGAEVVVADMFDPAQVESAMQLTRAVAQVLHQAVSKPHQLSELERGCVGQPRGRRPLLLREPRNPECVQSVRLRAAHVLFREARGAQRIEQRDREACGVQC